MESFQLLNTEEDEEDMELTPVPLERPGISGHAVKVRRSDADQGSVESLSFSFANGNATFQTPAAKKAAWIHRTRRYFTLSAVCALCFLLGFFLRRNLPYQAKPADDTESSSGLNSSQKWRDQVTFTPDFARCPQGYADRPPLLVISFDGFRADLLQNTNALRLVAEHGLRAPHMRPVFPSNTFPNHYSIVTGLYPESHGIIDNTFSNADFSKTFATYLKSRFEPEWWKGRPIWEIAQKQGRRVFAHFWPGSEVLINGVQPDHWMNFTLNETVEARVKTLIEFLTLSKESRPHLILSYYPEPDWTAHNKGLRGAEFIAAITSVDEFVSSVMQSLTDNNLMDCVDIIFLSDHGIADYDHTAYPTSVLKDKLGTAESDKIKIFDGLGSQNRISPAVEGASAQEIALLLQCTDKSSPYRVYTRETIPRRYHFTNSDRIAPVLLTANVTYALHTESHKNYTNVYAFHGWDPVFPEMRALFTAYGPSFRKNVTVEPFLNVELFNLFTEMLGIDTVDNNGTDGSLSHFLRNSKRRSEHPRISLRNFTVADPVSTAVSPLCESSSTCQQIPANDMPQVSKSDREDTSRLHVGTLGMPFSADSGMQTVVFIDKHWTTGFSEYRGISLWVAFRMKSFEAQTSSFKKSLIRAWNNIENNCQHQDPRVVPRTQPLCKYSVGNTTVIPTTLFPQELASGLQNSRAIMLSTNAVPMFEPFRDGIWKRFWEMVVSWDNPERHIRIITGPVFDSLPPFGIADDFTVRRQNPGPLRESRTIPSHFFVILTRKRLQAQCESVSCDIDVLAFVIPHQKEGSSLCQFDKSYFLTHSSTVRDVELLTGLTFFMDVPEEERIRLSVRLVDSLWDTTDKAGKHVR